jgi:hypothetical protein
MGLRIYIHITCWLVLGFNLPGWGYGQTTLSGMVKDANTLQSIPFVSLGVAGKTYGTLSDEFGQFTCTLPQLLDSDTIRVSAIGYKSLSISVAEIKTQKNYTVYLTPMVYDLTEVQVKPKKLRYKMLGTSKYSTTNCTAFMGIDDNWKGEQAAILAENKEEVTMYLESFGFYIIKNEYTDSLQFRIMLYEVNEKGYPGTTFLQKPILFKTNIHQGEVRIDLKPYNLSTKGNFFISLECLEEKMESAKFCFAGSIKVPSYVKSSPFSRWNRVKGGGGDFNIQVSYKK